MKEKMYRKKKRIIRSDADLDVDWFVRVRLAKGRNALELETKINRICDDLYKRGYFIPVGGITGNPEDGAIISYWKQKPNFKRYY